MPRIVDANKNLIMNLPQFVDHPGLRDIEAIHLGQRIVQAVNERESQDWRYENV